MNVPEFTIDSGMATLVAAALAGLLTFNTFIFSWLKSSFAEIRSLMAEQQVLYLKRHEDNLRKFSKISVALAKLGQENGT